MQYLTILEADYAVAKQRLQAAQQERLEAAAEFLSVRATLRQTLETLWPASCECGERLGYGENKCEASQE